MFNIRNVEYDIQEIINSGFEHECMTKEEILERLHTLLFKAFKYGQPYIDKSLEVIEKEWLEVNRCPCYECYEELKTKSERLNDGEYLGKPYVEVGTKRYCPSCGWEEE